MSLHRERVPAPIDRTSTGISGIGRSGQLRVASADAAAVRERSGAAA